MDLPTRAPAALGTPEAYREAILELLAMAQISAELGVTFASIGDDIGLEYVHRRLVATVRVSLSILNDLRALKAEQKARGSAHAEPA